MGTEIGLSRTFYPIQTNKISEQTSVSLSEFLELDSDAEVMMLKSTTKYGKSALRPYELSVFVSLVFSR